MDGMNILDLFIAVPLAWGIYKGFRRGLIIELTTMAALLIGIFGAVKGSHIASDYIREQIYDGPALPVLAFAVTFILLVLLVHLIGKSMEKVVDMVSLGFLNRIGGAIFRGLKTAMVLSLVIWMLSSWEDTVELVPPETRQGSLLYEPMAYLAPTIIPAVKQSDWGERVEELWEEQEINLPSLP